MPAPHASANQIWKGTHRISDHALLDTPVALTSFIPDATPPRTPALAVAAGCHVYIFEGLKPFYKFTLPLRPCGEAEEATW
jgi:Bardet-Biedl syndrome 1 protein